MAPDLVMLPTPAGLAVAAASVALGAPLFSEGLRTLRLWRGLGRLERRPIADAPGGLTHVSGRVVLESPLFSPVSGTACAAYRLEVGGPAGSVRSATSECRAFRVVDGASIGRVQPEGVRLRLAVTTTREVRAEQPLTENLSVMLGRMPEAMWLRRTGATLTFTERVLAAGSFCHVVGTLRRGRAAEMVAEEQARTGTDDAPVALGAGPAPSNPALAEPDAWIDAGDHLNFLLVSDRSPDATALAVARWRAAGVVAGPALTMFGLVYFAHVADRMRAAGRF